MKSTTWKDITELAGITALVASLIFVGLQMKQAHQIAQAATYQARTDSEMSIFNLIFESEALEQSMVKDLLGQPLSDYEKQLMRLHFNPRMMYYENAHFQWEQGMITDDHWRAQRNGLSAAGSTDLFYDWWQVNRDNWRVSFAQVVDEVLAELVPAE